MGVGGIKDKIKFKVFEAGWEKFVEVSEELGQKVGETINAVFDNRVESATKVIGEVISLCENLIKEQEKAHEKLLKECETDRSLILQKRQEIAQVQKELEVVLNQVVQFSPFRMVFHLQ